MRVSCVGLSADGLTERPTVVFDLAGGTRMSSEGDEERGVDVGDGERRRACGERFRREPVLAVSCDTHSR